jgi:hypothetical protein
MIDTIPFERENTKGCSMEVGETVGRRKEKKGRRLLALLMRLEE